MRKTHTINVSIWGGGRTKYRPISQEPLVINEAIVWPLQKIQNFENRGLENYRPVVFRAEAA